MCIPLVTAASQLEQDHDAGRFELAFDGVELLERVTDFERDVSRGRRSADRAMVRADRAP